MALPMDYPAAVENFEKAPHALMQQVRAGTLTAGDLFAYLTIAQICYRERGEVNMPQDDLAAEVGCQPRMLRYHLTALIQHGWLIARKLGVGRACAYRTSSPAAPQMPSGKILPLGRQRTTVKRQPVAVQVATGLPVDRQYIAAVNPETPVQTGEDSTPEVPDSGVSVANAPQPTPPPEPKARLSRKKRQPAETETPCPDTIELTDVSYATAQKMGFDRETTDFELERFMAKARAKSWTNTNWRQAFRSWLLNEVKWARERGVPVGSRAPGKPQKTGPTASSRGPVSEEFRIDPATTRGGY